MATASTVYGIVRSLMGDDDTAVYLDATLAGPVNQAYRLVQQKLVNRGCSVLRTVSNVISLPANTTLISVASSPALPSDLMVPYQMWEKPAGAATSEFQIVQAVSTLPNRSQTDRLEEWCFAGGGITFVGATVAIDIKVQYELILPELTIPSAPVGIVGAEDAMAFYAAAYMANSRGQDFKYFENKAEEAIDELVSRFTHSNQHIHGRRRIPYGRRLI